MRYGKAELLATEPNPAELSGLEPVAWRPSRVVDDVLGVLRPPDDDESYRGYLLGEYQPLAAITVTGWGDFARTILRAADEGQPGQIPWPQLAPFLAGITYLPGEVVRVDGFPAFVAWCLLELIRAGNLKLVTCENCGIPWTGEGGSAFCSRPAPGRTETCNKIMAQRRYIERHPDFNRERKRLYERVARGTLPRDEYDQWLKANRPGARFMTWMPFDAWKALAILNRAASEQRSKEES